MPGCRVSSVLTPFTGLPEEFGRPGKEYVLAEGTPEVLATAVGQLLGNRTMREYFTAAGRQRDISLDRYTEHYRELAEAKR